MMQNRPAPRGLGLIEVLVAASLLAIVSLGLTQLFKGSFRANRMVSDNVAKNAIEQTIDVVLGNPEACLDAFSGVPLDDTLVPIVLKDLSGNAILQEGKTRDGWTVTTLRARSGPAPTDGVYLATINIQLDKSGVTADKRGNPTRNLTRNVNLVVVGGSIRQCILGSAGSMNLVNLRQGLSVPGGPPGRGLTIGYVPPYVCPAGSPPPFCFPVAGQVSSGIWRNFVQLINVPNAKGNLWMMFYEADVSANGGPCIWMKSTVYDMSAGGAVVPGTGTAIGYGCGASEKVSTTRTIPGIIINHNYRIRFAIGYNTANGVLMPGSIIGTWGARVDIQEWVHSP